jgi:hypothetical protein
MQKSKRKMQISGSSGFRVANLAKAISVRRLGDFTAEARRTRSKEFLMNKYSELCELCASVVSTSSQKTGKRQISKCTRPKIRQLCILHFSVFILQWG